MRFKDVKHIYMKLFRRLIVIFAVSVFGCAPGKLISIKGTDTQNIPVKEGVFIISGKNYIPVNKGRLLKVTREFPFTKTETAVESILSVSGEFTQVVNSKKLRFLNIGSNLVRLVKLRDNNIAIVEKTHMSGVEEEADFIGCETKETAEYTDFITVKLETGKYAFITKTWYNDTGLVCPAIESVFLLEIIK